MGMTRSLLMLIQKSASLHLQTSLLLIHPQKAHGLEEDLKPWEEAYLQACALLESGDGSLDIKVAIESLTREVRSSASFCRLMTGTELSITAFTDRYSKEGIRSHYIV